MICKSERLSIRKFSIGDVEAFYDLCSKEEITYWFKSWKVNRIKANEMIATFIKEYEDIRIQERNVSFIVERISDKEVIGYCLLGPEPETGEVEIVYAINPIYQRQGYASEVSRTLSKWAFENYDLEYLVATIDKENRASSAVVEKSGFEKHEDNRYQGLLYYRLYRDRK